MLQKGLIDLCSNSKHSTDRDRVDCFLQYYSFTASGQLDGFIIGLIYSDRDSPEFIMSHMDRGLAKKKILNNQRLYCQCSHNVRGHVWRECTEKMSS